MEKNREASMTKTTWGTWEELLLASAVERHGSDNWDSVAHEVQSRTFLPATALACKLKYHDLRRRFAAAAAANDDADTIPWLDDLRKLRVAELRQEVQRYDVSILSLQSKVKRLEEERERSAEPNENGHGGPDLEDDSKENLSENDKTLPGGIRPDDASAGKSNSGEETDRENRSVNASNSSGAKFENVDETGDEDREPARAGSGKPDPVLSDSKDAVVEDSYNGSSEPNRRRKGDDSAELRDSVAQSKESSDVQSSASLTRKRKNRRKKEVTGGSSGEEPPGIDEDSRAIKRIAVESRPLIGLLEAIQTHKHSWLFERLLETQENERYQMTVRQHMDLQTIQTRLGQGSYSCSLGLYRDLMLLFTNALVFFPKSSPESVSAQELRDTVSSEMHKQAHRPDPAPDSAPPIAPHPKPEPERSNSLLPKHKPSVPILVCRKRSSIPTKPSSTTSIGIAPKGEAKTQEKKAVVDPRTPAKPSPGPAEEQNSGKPVTGTRTMRRSGKSQKQKGSPDSADKGGKERTTDNKKKSEALASEKKKSAVDFLKRIKKNSPVEAPKIVSSSTSGGGRGGEQKKKTPNMGKGEQKGKERVLRQSGKESSPSKRSVGRPPKKAAEAVPAKRGKGESAGKEASASKRPKKRARR